MDRHTVTISEDNIEIKAYGGKTVRLIKTMSCTCGWVGETMPARAGGMATHHLNYTHGGGRIIYHDFVEEVGKKTED